MIPIRFKKLLEEVMDVTLNLNSCFTSNEMLKSPLECSNASHKTDRIIKSYELKKGVNVGRSVEKISGNAQVVRGSTFTYQSCDLSGLSQNVNIIKSIVRVTNLILNS